MDEEIDSTLACTLLKGEDRQLINKNIYLENLFGCSDLDSKTLTSNDPYDLPPVDPGEVC
jgi:hypothetical protein